MILLGNKYQARRSNQSSLKENSPGRSLEGLMLKLKLQYFGHLMKRADSLEKTLMLGKSEGGRRRGWQRMRWLDGITNSTDMIWINSGSWWRTGRPGVLQSMVSQRVRHDWATELKWTELMVVLFLIFWEASILFPIVAALIYFPTNSAQRFLVFHILANTCYLLSF